MTNGGDLWKQQAEQCRTQMKQLLDQLAAVQEEAGITHEMEKVSKPDFWPNTNARYGSLEAEQDDAKERERSEARTRRLTRDAYFGVADIELRKRLIEIDSNARDAWKNWWHYQNKDAHARFKELERAQPKSWARWAGFYSVVLVVGGYMAGAGVSIGSAGLAQWGLAGAVSGAVIGTILAMRMRDATEFHRLRSIADARDQLEDEDHLYQGVLRQKALFTVMEKLDGQRQTPAPARD